VRFGVDVVTVNVPSSLFLKEKIYLEKFQNEI